MDLTAEDAEDAEDYLDYFGGNGGSQEVFDAGAKEAYSVVKVLARDWIWASGDVGDTTGGAA